MTRSIDLAWLAGLVEGEGYIGLRRTYQPILQLDMTDLDVVDRVLTVTGVGTLRPAKELPSGKTSYRWVVTSSRDAAALLMTLYPLLGERRQGAARAALAAWRATYGARRRGAWRCGNGHEMTPENVRLAEGRRRCRKCQAEAQERHRSKAATHGQ